jgi:hypothetical protein
MCNLEPCQPKNCLKCKVLLTELDEGFKMEDKVLMICNKCKEELLVNFEKWKHLMDKLPL